MRFEKQYRLPEVERATGYTISSLRQKILRRQLGYRKSKSGRIITIPESEVTRLMGEYRPPLKAKEVAEPTR